MKEKCVKAFLFNGYLTFGYMYFGFLYFVRFRCINIFLAAIKFSFLYLKLLVSCILYNLGVKKRFWWQSNVYFFFFSKTEAEECAA